MPNTPANIAEEVINARISHAGRRQALANISARREELHRQHALLVAELEELARIEVAHLAALMMFGDG